MFNVLAVKQDKALWVNDGEHTVWKAFNSGIFFLQAGKRLRRRGGRQARCWGPRLNLHSRTTILGWIVTWRSGRVAEAGNWGVRWAWSHNQVTLFAAKDTCAACQLRWYKSVPIEAQICFIRGVKKINLRFNTRWNWGIFEVSDGREATIKSLFFAAKDTCASCQLSDKCVTIEAQICYIRGVK